MKTLTLSQPWASLISLGTKTIVTRSWSTPHRGSLAIHAGPRCETGATGDYIVEDDTLRGCPKQYLMRGPMAWPYRLPLKAVVATCELVDVVPTLHLDYDGSLFLVEALTDDMLRTGEEAHRRDVSDQLPYGDFTPGRFAWILDSIKPITPVPANGRGGLWEWAP